MFVVFHDDWKLNCYIVDEKIKKQQKKSDKEAKKNFSIYCNRLMYSLNTKPFGIRNRINKFLSGYDPIQ